MKNAPVSAEKVARFPELTKSMRITIANAALKNAKENYYKKYDKDYDQLMKDYVTMAERQAEIQGENAKDVRRETARQACVSLAEAAALPKSPPPPAGWGTWFFVGFAIAAAIVVSVFTFGAGAMAGAAAVSAATSSATAAAATTASISAGVAGLSIGVGAAGVTVASGAAAAGAAAAAAVTAAAATTAATASLALSASVVLGAAVVGGAATLGSVISAAATDRTSKDSARLANLELAGHHELDQWNWKQVIDTTFEWDTLKCHKCVKSTKCIDQSYPWFGMPYCKRWDISTTECTDTQF